MRVLTSFETTAIAGGEFNTHIVIPTEPLTNEEALIASGFVLGLLGALGGFAMAMGQGAPSLGKGIAGAVAGAAIGAFGVPVALQGIANGMRYCYQKLGLL